MHSYIYSNLRMLNLPNKSIWFRSPAIVLDEIEPVIQKMNTLNYLILRRTLVVLNNLLKNINMPTIDSMPALYTI